MPGAARLGAQETIPVRATAPAVTAIRESAVVIRREGRVLLAQRPADAARWASLWEFPHGDAQCRGVARGRREPPGRFADRSPRTTWVRAGHGEAWHNALSDHDRLLRSRPCIRRISVGLLRESGVGPPGEPRLLSDQLAATTTGTVTHGAGKTAKPLLIRFACSSTDCRPPPGSRCWFSAKPSFRPVAHIVLQLPSLLAVSAEAP